MLGDIAGEIWLNDADPAALAFRAVGNWFLIERSDADILRICEVAGLRADQVSIKLESSGLTYIIEIKV
jgi:hypothetical protein